MTTEPAARTRPSYGGGREALLDAAIRVVSATGLRNLTYRAVAAEAGVTHGLVAHHFGSRETLLGEALTRSIRRSIDASSLLVAGGGIDDYVEGLADMVAAEPDLQAFQYELLLESRRNPQFRPSAEHVYDTYRDAARRGLEHLGITDTAVADVVFAALDGLVFQQITVGDADATRRAVAALRQLLKAHVGRPT